MCTHNAASYDDSFMLSSSVQSQLPALSVHQLYAGTRRAKIALTIQEIIREICLSLFPFLGGEICAYNNVNLM